MENYIQKFIGLFILATILSISNVKAQAPLGFNYQGVALTNAGTPIASKVISLRIALIESQQLGSVRYQEVHNVNTDAYGQFSVIIGNGQVATGKMTDVQWSLFPYYMKVELDLTGGTSYVFVGTSQLLSVPYALYANNAGAASVGVDSIKSLLSTITLSQKGDSIILNNNRGAIYIPKIDSLTKIVAQLASIKAGTIRYVKDSASKIPVAIGIGYDALALFDSVATNSANIAIGQNAGGALPKYNSPYSNNDNIFMGVQAGSGIGSKTGGGAAQNVMIGNYTGQYMNNLAFQNVVIGHEAGRFSGGTIPNKSVVYNDNVSIGYRSLQYSRNAQSNISIGADNLNASKDVSRNVAIGSFVANQYNGDDNVIIGSEMLQDSSSNGSKNVIIGSLVARNIRGSGNVILGYKAASDSIFLNTSNKLIIANDKTKTPLIYGDFENRKLKFNANIDSLSILNRINFVDENANDHINKYDTGYSYPLIYSRYFYGHYGDLVIQGMSKTYTGNIHFVTGSNISGYDPPTQRMVIMDNGNVGIGNFAPFNPPTSKLQVTGNVLATGYKTPTGTSSQFLMADGSVSSSTITSTVIPYTGATKSVDLGAYDMKVNGLSIGRGPGINNQSIVIATSPSNSTGNANTVLGHNAMSNNTSGNSNTIVGNNAMSANTTGQNNNAFGLFALSNNTSGERNTAFGREALGTNVIGSDNIAVGNSALYSNKGNNSSVAVGINAMQYADDRTIGRITFNTAVGYEALRGSITPANNIGQYNSVFGYQTLIGNTSGNYNSGIGYRALYNNNSGEDNVASGAGALYLNTTGSFNTALGNNALYSNVGNEKSVAIGHNAMFYADNRTSGRATGNTAVGYESLKGSTTPANNTGQNNTAVGYQALVANTSGIQNSSLGAQTLKGNTTGNYNVAIGYNALSANTTGSYNIAIGLNALKSNNGAGGGAEGNIAIGQNAMASALSTRGNTSIGYASLTALTIGGDNTAIGEGTLASITESYSNTAIGSAAMLQATNNSQKSVAIGVRAGQKMNGGFNTFLGFESGASNLGSGNVFLGSLSGFNAAFDNVSNKLIIQNADNAIPLVYGDFSSKQLNINGTLSTAGTIQAFSAKTSAHTILTSDEIITGDATSAIFTITLPTAVGKAGQTYTIKRINSGANAVTVGTTTSQTIDGSTTYALSAQYKYVKVVSDGANWIIVGNN
jgi:hypothetical protein